MRTDFTVSLLNFRAHASLKCVDARRSSPGDRSASTAASVLLEEASDQGLRL